MLLFTTAFTQSVELSKEPLQQPLPLYLHNGLFIVDESNKMPIENIAEKIFSPFSDFFKEVPKYLPPNKTWWMKLEIKNDYSADTTIVFYPGFQNYVVAYHSASGRFTKVGSCGNMIPASQLSIAGFRQALVLPIASQQISTFYISFKNVTTYQVDPFTPYLMSRASLDKAQTQLFRNKRIPDYIFFTGMGMFLIMLVYILIKWSYQKDAAYFYYALTIFGSSAYFLFNFFKEHNNQILFTENPFIVHLITDSFIFLSGFAYWRFVQRFLYIDKTKWLLGKFIHYGSLGILLAGFISLLYALIFRNVTGIIRLNSAIGIVLLLSSVFILISIKKINQPLRRFVYGGVFSLLFFYALGSLYEFARNTSWNFFPESLGGGTPFLMMGNVIEMLFFTTGLAYRNKIETEQLASISISKAEAEMKALRAQMNPHFIFNCMNTIDAYIFKEQPEKASAFLNKFSKLIRQTLENSQYPLISIGKEIESIQLFTVLEQERFDYSFDAKFDIEQELLQQLYKVPPLLIQPYVENAILHGLRNNVNKRGRLVIAVKELGDLLSIKIADNGIGRTAAQQINQQQGKTHQSMSMELTKQRLSMLPGKGTIQVLDNPIPGETGTEVTITIPKMK